MHPQSILQIHNFIVDFLNENFYMGKIFFKVCFGFGLVGVFLKLKTKKGSRNKVTLIVSYQTLYILGTHLTRVHFYFLYSLP